MLHGFRKENHIFLHLAFVYILVAGWSRPNKNNTLAPGCSRGKKKGAPLYFILTIFTLQDNVL